MRTRNFTSIISFVIAAITLILTISTFILMIPVTGMEVSALNVNQFDDPMVVVSLGDSYSAGEGVPPFYGQNQDRLVKMGSRDWLAHRSTKSWPGKLLVPGTTEADDYLWEYRVTGTSDGTKPCEWYFEAVSGAECKHVYQDRQYKTSRTQADPIDSMTSLYDTKTTPLPIQIDVFGRIESTVDYVTLTIGGNDAGFADIISACVKDSATFGRKTLENQINSIDIDSIMDEIKTTYNRIADAAGPEATIVVAGYPKLLNKKGLTISNKEAQMVNNKVSEFNDEIEALVNECAESGMNIYFVDVETEFSGHEAYTDDPWINEVILFAEPEDIDCLCIASSYSVHPNEKGTNAYGRCVNQKIAEIEAAKITGSISGKICKASDRTSPVANATIKVFKNGNEYRSVNPNSYGNYSIELPVGDYRIEIEASGYIDFTAYATVTENNNFYMETFLLVEGEEGETGTAYGTISNALTGIGVGTVSITVREGWNNNSFRDVVKTTSTNIDGGYFLSLPLGNYTLIAEKEGYVSAAINVIVQKETFGSQNGTITPVLSGDNYRMVLTWGVDPSDLDSHVEGTLNDGGSFHVAYYNISQMDGEVEVCNLDVDDVTSYGPETITLQITKGDSPYYYYIYKFAGDGDLASSGAQVKIYQGDTLKSVFNVPTDLGSGRFWNLFAIINEEIVIKNTITDSADITYAD
jgi:lysophospholipase L1-like esterase